MRATLLLLAIHHHNNLVGILDGRQAMRNHHNGLRVTVGNLVNRFLHLAFALRVQRRGGFVEQQDRGMIDNRTCNRDSLFLSATQPIAHLAHIGIITMFELLDKCMRIRRLGSLDNIRIRDIGITTADILFNALRKQKRQLRYKANMSPQILDVIVVNLFAINQDIAANRIIVALQQINHGTLATARWAHNRQCLATLNLEAHLVQHNSVRVRGIRKRHIAKFNVALQVLRLQILFLCFRYFDFGHSIFERKQFIRRRPCFAQIRIRHAKLSERHGANRQRKHAQIHIANINGAFVDEFAAVPIANGIHCAQE
mmetsp:Transcript_36248/g.59552  ORF Transcript_36248/g.59552 Transcript_36248/m.59552 type:complete len:313 (-) Transcript_36248:352-1290(-)